MVDHRGNFKLAFDTILARKLQSFLTVLGIIVGVMTVIIIASILMGMRQNIVTYVEEYGTDNIFAFHLNTGIQISRRSREEMKRKPLTIEDARVIKEQCSSVLDVSWQGMPFESRVHVQYQGKTLRSFNFMGVPSNYGAVANVKLTNGRFFSQTEDTHRTSVVVLGPDAAESLFPQLDPVGKRMLINGRLFTVLGTTEESKSGVIGSEADTSVIIPYQTFHKMLPWEDKHLLFIKAKPGMLSNAMDEAESLLRRRRGIRPGEPNNFDLTTADRFIEQFDAITATMGLIILGISSIGLLVGGIGVMNIMLISVTERTREIGIRKAIGATKQDIIVQFLFEAMTLSGIGGLFGVVLAVISSYIVTIFVPELPTVIPLWAVIAGLSVSLAVGLFFGIWPAQKAAKLDPIEALRYE